MTLNPKQQAFVDAFIVHRDCTKAAIAAGYSAATAGQQGHRLYKNVEIAKVISERIARVSERADVSETYVLTNLKECVERCMQRAPVMTFSPIDRTYVQAQDDEGNNLWQFDSKGAIAALNLIGKHLGMFVDRTRHENADGSPLSIIVEHVHGRS